MKKLSMAAIGFGVVLLFRPALAHHSFQAEYDQSKPLTLVGKVTKVVTDNPHVENSSRRIKTAGVITLSQRCSESPNGEPRID